MALNSASMRASAAWDYRATVTGFNGASQKDDLSGSIAADVSVYQHVLISEFTLAAAATQDLDLYSLTSIAGTSSTATITKAIAALFVATATVTGGQMKIAPHPTTNPVSWGCLPSAGITYDVGTAGAWHCFRNGTTLTVSNTEKVIRVSNPGSQTITVSVFLPLGT